MAVAKKPSPGVNPMTAGVAAVVKAAAAAAAAPAPPPPPPSTWTPAGGGQFVGAGPTNTPTANNYAPQPAKPAPAPSPPPPPAPVYTPPPAPTGPSNQDILNAIQAAQNEANLRAQAAERQQRESASAFLTNTLRNYGLDSLASAVDGLIQQWGSNTDVISLKLKDTGAYQKRFKGLIDLQKRGITDVQNEARYIELESSYRQAFRETGLQGFLGDAGSEQEQAKIADIAGKYSLSVNEVRDRISDSQRVVANTSSAVKDQFRNYYGIGTQDLVAYSLDPTKTAEVMNRQTNAAIVGGVARDRGLNVGATISEAIAGLAGASDINQGQIGNDLTQAALVRDATARLAAIDNTTLTDDEAVAAATGIDKNAIKKVDTLQSRERARFGGSSAFQANVAFGRSGV